MKINSHVVKKALAVFVFILFVGVTFPIPAYAASNYGDNIYGGGDYVVDHPIPPGGPSATPISSCPHKAEGDANCDGKIDGVDYTIWLGSQCHIPSGSPSFCAAVPANRDADFNRDTNRDDTDYQIWLAHRWIIN